jgi:hypothetical protein
MRQVLDPGPEFDDFWEKTKHFYPNTNVRTREVLWWYLSPTAGTRRHLYAAYRNNTLVGFSLFLERSAKGRNAIRFLVFADIWCPGNEGRYLDLFLKYAAEQARKLHCVSILLPHHYKLFSTFNDSKGIPAIDALSQHEYIRIPAQLSGAIMHGNSYFAYLQGDRCLF